MVFDPITEVLGKLIDRFLPDPAAAAAAKNQLASMSASGELQIALAQITVDNTEASNPRLFVSGWRPYIGWVCGTGLAYQILIYPSLVAFIPKIMPVDTALLLPILASIIGLRTLEKHNGVDTK